MAGGRSRRDHGVQNAGMEVTLRLVSARQHPSTHPILGGDSVGGWGGVDAASSARSVQSRRGWGLVLRSTAASWRRTRSSMSLDDGAQGSSVSQLSSWLKIR